MFKEIGIFIKDNLSNSSNTDVMNSMINSLLKLDINISIDEFSSYKNESFKELKHEDFVKKVDLIIVFGGDGTLLNAARKYLNYEIPILGINMGNVGFLTDISVETFEESIEEVFEGNYKIEERNLVSAKFCDKHLYGLNEVLVHSGSYAQLMRYRLIVDEKVVYEQRSDG